MLRIIPIIFFRLVFPLVLLLCCLVRPSMLSLLYGLFVLIWPFIPNVDTRGTPACTKRYLVTCIFLSCLAVLAQLIFHITLLSIPPYGGTIIDCNVTDYILRTIGLQKLDEADPLNIARLIAPDITACIICVVTGVVCFFYQGVAPASVAEHPSIHEEVLTSDAENPPLTPPVVIIERPPSEGGKKSPRTTRSAQFCIALLRLSDFIVILLLALIAVIWPCALSAVYFLTFLFIMTWWATYLPLKRPALNGIKIFLLIYCAAHLVVLYLYQFQVFQENVEPFSFAANITGLTPFVRTRCQNVWQLSFETNLTWSAYVNPILLFLFYIYCSFQYLLTAEGISRNRFVKGRNTIPTTLVSSDDESSVHEELLGTEEDEDVEPSASNEQQQIGDAAAGKAVKRTPSKNSQRISRLLSLGALASGKNENNRPLANCVAFCVRHSYALALITMMAWAITYHSWLSFVWLVLACGIWLWTNSRTCCFWLSPFIVFYAEALLCLEFIYGMKSQLLADPKVKKNWPDDVGDVSLVQIGLITPTIAACVPLFIKVLYSLPFWLTLRLFLRDRYFDRHKQLRQTGYGTFEIVSTQQSISGNSCIGGLLIKYWIYVVGLVLLSISIRQPVVAYTVCYMMFFVVLITVLQISFRVWRVMLYVYWLILVTFSIAVLLTVYVYQFHGVPETFYNWTHWPNNSSDINVYQDLGLIEYDSASLFVQLLTPISFLIVVIMQMKFFHSGFMRMTDMHALLNSPPQSPSRTAAPVTTTSHASTSSSTAGKRTTTLMEQLEKCYNVSTDFLWRLAEIHVGKAVAFALMMLAVYEVNAVNFVFMLLISIMLFCRSLHMLLSVTACLWAAAIVLAKMLFQMTFVTERTIEIASGGNCTTFDEKKVYPSTWAGFEKTLNISWYLRGYIAIFALLTFQAVVHIRQRYRRVVLHQMTPARGILFPNVTRREADDSIMKCLQYLMNYWFYKFGVEATFIMIVIDVAIRMDAVALLYAVCLLILVALPRHVLARVWYVFVLFLAVFIPLQYAVCVGLPPSLCVEYPWDATLNDSMIVWLYLPDYNKYIAPEPKALIGDFFVLLLACCQLYVFNIELSPNGRNFEGGDNTPIDVDSNATTKGGNDYHHAGDGDQRTPTITKNPVPNFINDAKTYLDALKMFVFVYFHWITLVIVFVAGVGSNSLFALFYLIAVFALLWKGNDLYLEPYRRIKCRWYALVFYNVVAIILKVALQIVGCVYWSRVCTMSALIRLFSITCLGRGLDVSSVPETCQSKNVPVEKEEAEILYDGLCFAFLIIQMRIFSSWYFKHTIAEFQAERVMAARGAALINQLIRKEMKEQQEKEDKIYKKLKEKTDRIREKYVKQFAGKKLFESETYPDAKRGGDYYMFEYESEVEEEDILELEPPKDSIAPEVTAGGGDEPGIGPIQLAHKAMIKDFDLKETLDEADEQDKRKREGQKASTSRKGDDEIVSEEDVTVKVDDKDKTEDQAAAPSKLASICAFLGKFSSKFLDHCSFWFNKWSRDYRYVAYVLKKEKRMLKDSPDYVQVVQREGDVRRVRKTIYESELGRRFRTVRSDSEIERVEKEVQTYWMEHNVVVRFLIACYYLLVSHTELLCWIMIILNQMGNASILSLPLPFLAFFWGTLCSPRPPIFFWVVLITYTEAMIVAKCICQFGIFFDTDTVIPVNDPLDPRRIIGVEKKDFYAAWDVALLMVLFFHRYVLKALGLWKTATDEQNVVFPTAQEEQGVKRNGDASPRMITAREELTSRAATDDVNLSGNIVAGEVEDDTKQAEIDSEAKKKGRWAYCTSFPAFYRHLLHPIYRYIMDLYAMMFLCDVICFLILAFGYSSFGVSAGNSDVVSDIQSNKVPLPFVSMLITLMLLIIIDRGIYLRKNVMSKLIFQYFLVLGVHMWIFFALPAITDKSTFANATAQLWYFVKCIYFLLSAWQIRNGYPSRILGNLLTKRYNMLNYCLFTGFMAVPFIFELRTLIDWIWTETCMPLFDFFSMENMYAVIYRLKCMRKFEKDYPVPKGVPKGTIVKYGMGCPILLLIVLLLWLPLLLFALVNAIGLRLIPVQARFTVVIQGYPPIYSMDAQSEDLRILTTSEYNVLYSNFSTSKTALTFLRDFTNEDTVRASFRSGSLTTWGISQPSRDALLKELNGSHDMKMTINYEFVRPRASSSKEPVRQTSSIAIVLNQTVRQELAELIDDTNRRRKMEISNAFPPFVEVPSIGEVQPARPLLAASEGYTESVGITSAYSTLTLRISHTGDDNSSVFWTVGMRPAGSKNDTKATPGLLMLAFVDKVFPSAFDSFTSGGIIGVYVIVVLAAGRFFRGMVVNSLLDVIIAEMPNVDRLLQLCLDIFLVREFQDFLLELDLFAKLIFLFRSPETLIRWSRPKLE